MKSTIEFADFQKIDIRIGRVLDVDEAKTRTPAYRMVIDFGSAIGTRVSCGAYRNYARDDLIGRQVVCVLNFAPKKMGPETSEVLVLGVPHDRAGTILLTPLIPVELGVAVF